MTFELEPGENKLSQHDVRLVEERRTYPASLILTNRRAVLTFTKTPRIWWWAFLWIYALFATLAAHGRKARVRHQIRRDRFGSVEPGDGGILVFHDQGEGYAHTSFAITSDAPFTAWQQRMHQWANATDFGSDEPAPLPAARVVDR